MERAIISTRLVCEYHCVRVRPFVHETLQSGRIRVLCRHDRYAVRLTVLDADNSCHADRAAAGVLLLPLVLVVFLAADVCLINLVRPVELVDIRPPGPHGFGVPCAMAISG